MASRASRDAEGVSPGFQADTHVTLLAAWSVLGGVGVFLAVSLAWWGWGLQALARSAWMGPWAWVVPGLVSRLVGLIVAVCVVLAAGAVVGGVGLWRRREWGRVVTLSVAVAVGLFAVATITLVPLVYALYGVWALTRSEVAEAFKEPATPERVSEEDADVSGPP